jgi:osomolarity two-component system response regulator SSK1
MIPHHLRSHTDPHLHEGQPLDAEFSGLGLPESYHFDSAAPPAPPAFVRTFSAPLPHRVGYLRHPLSPTDDPLASYSAHPPRQMSSFSALGHDPQYRPPPRSNSSDQSSATRVDSTPGETESPLQTLSLELADSVQTAIQTLLHLSPPHLLDNAKEQYSGCTVQMPTTSLSALLSSMRSLNYLSANLQALCEPGKAAAGGTEEGLLAAAASMRREDFDIGELLQTVADLLSGHAAQAGVDLVLFHGDASIKHISVTGDGEGLGYMLSHVSGPSGPSVNLLALTYQIIRQILLVAHQGDTIELGLQILPQSPSMTPRVSLPLTASEVEQRRATGGSAVRSASPGRTLPSPPSGHLDGPLLCVFEIVHNIAQAPDSATATPKAELNPFTHLTEQKEATQPKLDTLLCRRLLQHQHANLKVDAQPSSPLGSGLPRRAYEVSVLLPRGKPILETPPLTVEEEAVRQPFPSVQLAREPTLAELSSFQDSLKGKKVFLHASLASLFARHLTSYLAAWGLDIYHIPIEESDDNVFQERSGVRSAPQDGGEVVAPASNELASSLANMSLNSEPKSGASGETEKFIIIDDDVQVLRRELLRLRSENGALALKPRLTKRPTLTSRARSTPHVRQISTAPKSPSVVLIHFTSLAKYNQVRDVVSTFLGSPTFSPSGALVHPEIMVVPKPVGPRRFLTALHTAVNQPVVDPFFAPIATSPRSPGGGFLTGSNRTPLGSELGASGGFFDSVAEESGEGDRPRPASESSGSQKARSPLGEYPPAQATIVRTDHGLHLSLPTPGEILATPASEYFSNATTKAGSSGASGVVMQSPDGRPFGMFFEPPVKNERRMSVARMTSDSVRRRGPPSRRTSAGMVLDEAHGGVGKTSPQGSRRASTLSGGGEDKALSRRSSGRTEPLVKEDRVARAAGRRKTLPANGEPIIAKGRERSSTITQSSIWRKPGSGTVSPLMTSPKDEDPPTIPMQPSFHPPKARKQAAVPEIEDIHRLPGAPAGDVHGTKKSKEDVVVPPINVLIVEGE